MDAATLQVLGVVFLATLIRSAFGFGEALVAVPLLALCIPLKVAAPLAVLVSITIAATVVAQDWRKNPQYGMASGLHAIWHSSGSVAADEQASTGSDGCSGDLYHGVCGVFAGWPQTARVETG